MSIQEGLLQVLKERKIKLISKATARKWYNEIKRIKKIK